jgi:uncharacterized protein YecE (DUF72 family)
MTSKGKIRIGTSGWHYDHWIGPFYPQDLESSYLDYYVRHLATAEINNSFYQLPKQETLVSWRDNTPPGFDFAVKASRYITHMKKLKNPEQSLNMFFGRVRHLEDKCGPILFQLPPNWGGNPRRLDHFLDALPDGYRYVFEFRDKSWFTEDVYQVLETHGATFCIYDLEGEESPKKITADLVYIRLHGPSINAYEGKYTKNDLAGWAGALTTWADRGHTIYVYFDNDQNGYAAQNALELQDMIS